jgi:thymidylate kinase
MLLDLAPETATKRKSTGRDRYERDIALLGRVRESYHRLAESEGWSVIDAEQSKDVVAQAVIHAVLPRLSPPSARGHS